jgi:hypothetical protein
MTDLLKDILATLTKLPPDKMAEVSKQAIEATKHMKFIPNPGPQTDAYLSRADILLYGGAAGGGKTGLMVGLALNDHERSLIMRRHYTDLNGICDQLIKFAGARDGFSGGSRPKMRIGDKKLIEFGAAKEEGSVDGWQGQEHDLLCFDEACQFLEAHIRFLMTWNRSITKKQRCRTILASNPPVNSQGQWIISMFRPWLDITYSKPAKHGELRWFVTDPDDRDFEVPGPEPYQFPGEEKPVIPKSRTFIQAKVSDNPYLVGTSYEATLDGLRGEMRSAMRDGNFMAARKDAPDQLIPTDWIRQAMERWTPRPPEETPMCSMGVDIAQGGEDTTTITWRHDWWFAPFVQVPGKETPYGTDVAALVVKHRRDGAVVVLDMGGGYGGGPRDHLEGNGIDVIPYKGAEGTTRRTEDKSYGFTNTRAMAYWRMREALNPDQPGGSPVALPNDPELMAELTIVSFEILARGIKITTKEDVIDLLGRSPDKADSVIMCWHGGPRGYVDMREWSQHQGGGRRGRSRQPQAVMSGPRIARQPMANMRGK